jgi:hypothetical protein
MTLTQTLIFVATMLILFGGLFHTIRVFRRDLSGPAPLRARARKARRGAARGTGA